MTRDDIIKMAKEARLPYEYDTGRILCLKQLERFAALVAAAEREACAKVCDDHCGWTPRMIGETIRARGQA
jgi:hypothetical protein